MGMYGLEMIHILGLLLIARGSISAASECSFSKFRTCLTDLVGLEPVDFNFVSEEQMKEVCNGKRQAMQCASNFINNCLESGHRELYDASIGGNLKVVEEMCTDGSKINKGFLQNIDCFQKLKGEISFCNDKFKESQTALSKADMVDRLKLFYGCCAFEWHRNCLAKSARVKCNNEAADFVYYVATVLGGNVKHQLCSSSYSSCHGLHGVSQEEIDDKLENLSSGVDLISIHFFTTICLVLFCIKRAFL